MDYSKYQDLKIRPLEPGIVEIVMGDEGGKLSTAGHRMHAELAEKLEKRRVVAIVENNEARVDRRAGVRPVRDDNCVRVPAEAVVLFQQHHIVALLQDVGRGDAGHAAADDGHAESPADVLRFPHGLSLSAG